MEYKNDKCEFTAFVKAGLDSKEQENIEICIERVTKTVKEDFLNARARLYKDEVKNRCRSYDCIQKIIRYM